MGMSYIWCTAQYASDLVVELLDWTKHSNLHIPIRGCVFHHELNQFIPFQTGSVK